MAALVGVGFPYFIQEGLRLARENKPSVSVSSNLNEKVKEYLIQPHVREQFFAWSKEFGTITNSLLVDEMIRFVNSLRKPRETEVFRPAASQHSLDTEESLVKDNRIVNKPLQSRSLRDKSISSFILSSPVFGKIEINPMDFTALSEEFEGLIKTGILDPIYIIKHSLEANTLES